MPQHFKCDFFFTEVKSDWNFPLRLEQDKGGLNAL